MASLIADIEAQIAAAKTESIRQSVGKVREIGDGVARVDDEVLVVTAEDACSEAVVPVVRNVGDPEVPPRELALRRIEIVVRRIHWAGRLRDDRRARMDALATRRLVDRAGAQPRTRAGYLAPRG